MNKSEKGLCDENNIIIFNPLQEWLRFLHSLPSRHSPGQSLHPIENDGVRTIKKVKRVKLIVVNIKCIGGE